MPAYTYQPYENRFGATIAELLARQGDIRARQALTIGEAHARAAEQSGQAWGQAIGGIGQTIAAIPQQIQQAKTQQQQQDVLGLTLQQKRLELETAARVDQTKQRVNALIQDPNIFGPDGLINTKSILASLQQAPAGEVGPQRPVDISTVLSVIDPINESLTAGRNAKAAWEEHKANAIARMAAGALALGAPTPEQPEGNYEHAVNLGLAGLLKSGILQPEEADHFMTVAVENPASVPGMLREFVSRSTLPPIKLTRGESLVSPLDPSQTLATNVDPREAETARHNNAMEAIARSTGDRAAAAQAETARHNHAMESLGGQRIAATAADKTDLTPAGLDAAAQMYVKTGQLPPLGMGDKTTRKAIINRAAELMPGLDVASAKADYAANTATLTQLEKQRASIGAFEQTASKNIDIFLDTAGKVVDSGSPLANTYLRLATGKLLGSADQAAYDTARQVAVNEVAKIITNPNLSGQLSDQARKEVEQFNPAGATLKQTVAVMRLLKRDMQNRTDALDDQIKGVRERLKGGSPPPASGVKILKIEPVK